MFYADLFATSELYRSKVLQSTMEDEPLVIQLSGSDPTLMLTAVKIIEQQKLASAVDLNWGCPLREAKHKRFGAYMLDNEVDRDKVCAVIVHQCVHHSATI